MKEYPKMNSNFKRFDENTRVKFPAIIHYLRLGYNYQSLKDAQIDFNTKIDDRYYYTEGKYKGDIYEQLVEAMKDDNQDIYQWRRKYVRKNKSGVVPTLTANQGEGGHNVCLIKTKNGIRKMTPHECFNVQGFPKDFVLPEEMSDAKLYKQAGNSVCVSVIQRIAENIKEAVEETEKKEKTA